MMEKLVVLLVVLLVVMLLAVSAVGCVKGQKAELTVQGVEEDATAIEGNRKDADKGAEKAKDKDASVPVPARVDAASLPFIVTSLEASVLNNSVVVTVELEATSDIKEPYTVVAGDECYNLPVSKKGDTVTLKVVLPEDISLQLIETKGGMSAAFARARGAYETAAQELAIYDSESEMLKEDYKEGKKLGLKELAERSQKRNVLEQEVQKARDTLAQVRERQLSSKTLSLSSKELLGLIEIYSGG